MESTMQPASHQSKPHFPSRELRSRRELLRDLFVAVALFSLPAFAATAKQPSAFQGKEVFDRILKKADAGSWCVLPIGDLIGKIANELEGTPYKANTLELSLESEFCSVNLTALDCVTFYETCLGFARMLKKGGRTPDALLNEVSFTRYRGGKRGDYSTRLHYTTDWFADNESKHVVQLLSQLPGAEPFTRRVSLMTDHPEGSSQLVAQPKLVPKIKVTENEINKRSITFIPIEKIAAVEPLLKTGDIVGICTNIPGLDIQHTGLVIRGDDGVAHFMDATSRKDKMMVTVEPGPISEALIRAKNPSGAMFARPLEPHI